MMKFFSDGYKKYLTCQAQHGADTIWEKMQSTLKLMMDFSICSLTARMLTDIISLADFQK